MKLAGWPKRFILGGKDCQGPGLLTFLSQNTSVPFNFLQFKIQRPQKAHSLTLSLGLIPACMYLHHKARYQSNIIPLLSHLSRL
jgi:hypothetical protein